MTAAISAAILLLALMWQGEKILGTNGTTMLTFKRPIQIQRPAANIDDKRWQSALAEFAASSSLEIARAATSSDPLNSLGDFLATQLLSGYAAVKRGSYSQTQANTLAQKMGASVQAPSTFVPHVAPELKTVSDVSLERVLQYRADMRTALAGLITGDGPEFLTFAHYLETKNPILLTNISDAARRYRVAESAAFHTTVPQDAADIHLRAVNALGAYASILEQLVQHASDPLASVAILRTYNGEEQEMLYAFDALASYYVRKSKAQ